MALCLNAAQALRFEVDSLQCFSLTLQALLKCPEIDGAPTEIAASMADKVRFGGHCSIGFNATKTVLDLIIFSVLSMDGFF